MSTLKTENKLQKITNIDRALMLYDKYGSLAYGVILQIVPNDKLAQETLVELFNSSALLNCWDSLNEVGCVIRNARIKALESKNRMDELLPNSTDSYTEGVNWTPELIFNLSFKQGLSLELLADRFGMPKEELMKAVRTHISSIGKP